MAHLPSGVLTQPYALPLPYTLPPLSHGLLRLLASGAVNLQPVCAVKAVTFNSGVLYDLPCGMKRPRLELLLSDGDSERWVALAQECSTLLYRLKEAAVVRLHECVRSRV
jgi:hypothetical protein